MFVKLFNTRSNEALIVVSLSGPRIVVARLAAQEVITVIHPREGSWMAYALSPDCQRLVVAYQTTPGIDVWSIPTGEHLAQIGRYRAAQLELIDNGTKALIWPKQRGVVDLATGIHFPIAHLADVYGAMPDDDMRSIWLPFGKRSFVGRLWFDPMFCETKELNSNETIWTLRRSSVDSRIITLRCRTLARARERGSLECSYTIGGMPEWVHLLTGKDVASNGAFTGDGRYFLVNANNAKCVIVIDTATGVERQRLDFAADPMYPLEGSRALTSSGQIIDAEAGRLVDYVNKTAWWRKAGLKIGE